MSTTIDRNILKPEWYLRNNNDTHIPVYSLVRRGFILFRPVGTPTTFLPKVFVQSFAECVRAISTKELLLYYSPTITERIYDDITTQARTSGVPRSFGLNNRVSVTEILDIALQYVASLSSEKENTCCPPSPLIRLLPL